MFSLHVESNAFNPERIREAQARIVKIELKFDPQRVIDKFGAPVWRSYCIKQITGGQARQIEKFLEVGLNDHQRNELYVHLDEVQELCAKAGRGNFEFSVAPALRQVHNLVEVDPSVDLDAPF